MTPTAVFLAVLAAAARAGVVSFDAGPVEGAIFSADGYHVARLESDEREDRWLVDGRVRARGAPGTLPAAAVLSDDGASLLHLIALFGKDGGSLGFSAALDGRRVGAPYAEIQSLTVSARGRNAAYAAKTPAGWSVVSGQGVGPAFPEPPALLAVSDAATLYFARWKGKLWLYRDHKPVRRVDGEDVSVSADLRHVGSLVLGGADGAYVEMDAVRYGPYASASAPAFSRNGRHWAFCASEPGEDPGHYTMIVADGRPEAAAPSSGCSLLVDDGGRAFQNVIQMSIGEHGQINTFYLKGRRLSKVQGPPSVGLLAGGGHYVYPMLTPRGIAVGYDGRELDVGVPMALANTPVEFDGEREFHYWSLGGGRSLLFVCGSLDGGDPRDTRCARKAGSVFDPVK